jgi:hypothetical protein
MKKQTLNTAIQTARTLSGKNLVCWCSNNRGMSGRQVLVAELEDGINRAKRSSIQSGIVTSGRTGHWRGLVDPQALVSAVS